MNRFFKAWQEEKTTTQEMDILMDLLGVGYVNKKVREFCKKHLAANPIAETNKKSKREGEPTNPYSKFPVDEWKKFKAALWQEVEK